MCRIADVAKVYLRAYDTGTQAQKYAAIRRLRAELAIHGASHRTSSNQGLDPGSTSQHASESGPLPTRSSNR